MAENTLARNNALGQTPIYGLPYTVVYPFLDADGDLVSAATTPDAEVSKNCDTFADCTNESTEIATNSGVYYLNLTAAEMTADIVVVQAKSATAGMKTTVAVLYPVKPVTVHSGTAADDGSGTGDIVLDAGASAIDDFYNGMVVAAVIDSVTEVRIIDDYVGSTKAASVTPDWNTAPDNSDTFTIYLPPSATQVQQANVSHAANTAWGSGAITAGVVAPDAIGASELAADAATEIATAVWALATRTLTALDVDTGLRDLIADIKIELDTGLRDHISDRIDFLDTGLRKYVDNSDTGVKDVIADLDTGLRDLITDHKNELDTGIKAVLALTDTGKIATAVWAGDTGLRDLIGDIKVELDTGLRDHISDRIDFLDTGLRTFINTNDTGLRVPILAIKTQTDKMLFDTGGEIRADVRRVNNITIQGSGDTGSLDHFRPGT